MLYLSFTKSITQRNSYVNSKWSEKVKNIVRDGLRDLCTVKLSLPVILKNVTAAPESNLTTNMKEWFLLWAQTVRHGPYKRNAF